MLWGGLGGPGGKSVILVEFGRPGAHGVGTLLGALGVPWDLLGRLWGALGDRWGSKSALEGEKVEK